MDTIMYFKIHHFTIHVMVLFNAVCSRSSATSYYNMTKELSYYSTVN